jgi:Peptidase family S41
LLEDSEQANAWHPKTLVRCLLAVGLWGSITTAVSRAQASPFLIGKGEVWKYSAGGSHPPDDWKQASFDDAAWKSGRAGFGYGDSDDQIVSRHEGPDHRRSQSIAGSFSAADGFLNAFADLPQVTIVGEPNAGGSGATRQFQLPRTRLVIALSSMASFRPNGKLFDGNGIDEDVAVKPAVEDYTADADSVLAHGIDVINRKTR